MRKNLYLSLLSMFLVIFSVQADVRVHDLERLSERCQEASSWKEEALCFRAGVESLTRRSDRDGRRQREERRIRNQCVGMNVYGKWAQGGGCNAFGCYYPGGNCNAFGCYYDGGKCNAFGCVKQAPKVDKACDE